MLWELFTWFLLILYVAEVWNLMGYYDKHYVHEGKIFSVFYFIGILIWPIAAVITMGKRILNGKGH